MEVTIDRVGGLGDGVAETPIGNVYVPNALPGEKLLVKLGKAAGDGFAGKPVQRFTDADMRVAPPCRHFGRCGGCAAQHMSGDFYATWKHGQLLQTLARRRFDEVPVAETILCPAPRRRLRFAGIGRRAGAVLGFNARGSNQVVDLQQCTIAAPEIEALLPRLRDVLAAILGPKEALDAEVLAAENGIDLLLAGTNVALTRRRRESLIAFAQENGLLRVSFQAKANDVPEIVVQFDAPVVRFGATAVEPPPGAFLQPSLAGEEALRAAVRQLIPGGAMQVVELFAGCGTFTLPLAESGYRVQAFEAASDMVRAMTQAAGRASLGGRLNGVERDLVRQPLRPPELTRADVVILDPPRAGALDQVTLLSESSVPAIIYVSCNPASFARDAAILSDAGYRLMLVQPVDQFVYTPHLEIVSLFERA